MLILGMNSKDKVNSKVNRDQINMTFLYTKLPKNKHWTMENIQKLHENNSKKTNQGATEFSKESAKFFLLYTNAIDLLA